MKRKRILVTGGAGFIGSHLVELLVSKGNDVSVVDNLSNSNGRNLAEVDHDISFFRIDTRSDDFIRFLSKGKFEMIFHLAANAYVPPSVRDPGYDLGVNFTPLFHILEFLREKDDSTSLVFTSSAAVYGNPFALPMKEEHPTVPISPYGVGKLAAERYLAVFAELYGIKAASARLFSVYGPRQEKQIVYDFMMKLKKYPDSMEIIGDGRQTRDLVFVKDVAESLATIAENGNLRGETYNVATGVEATTVEIAEIVAGTMGLEPEFVFTGKVRGGDPDRWRGDNSRLASIGYVPNTSLEDGVGKTVEWFDSRFGEAAEARWTDPAFH